MDIKGPPGCFARVFSAVPKSLRISSALSNVALGKGQPSLGLLAGQGEFTVLVAGWVGTTLSETKPTSLPLEKKNELANMKRVMSHVSNPSMFRFYCDFRECRQGDSQIRCHLRMKRLKPKVLPFTYWKPLQYM